jgi:diadenosine tetraphosphate (Ap4A) HIT family hydrolase
MINDTIRKFGYPQTLIKGYDHWVALVRVAQPTLGSLILAAKSDCTAFGDLPADAFAELAHVTADIENALSAQVGYEKINYLMLMMVDPHVHFHVIPRYEGSRQWDGLDFGDAGWPKAPDLASAVTLNDAQVVLLVATLAPKLTCSKR